MNRLLLFLLCLATAAVTARAESIAWAKKVIHKDGAITETIVDPFKNTRVQLTKDKNGTLQVKRTFVMDTKGRIRNGLIQDGTGSILGRTEYGYDSWDRINEERLFHSKGPLVRRTLFEFTPDGKTIPTSWIYDPSRPADAPVKSTKPVQTYLPVTSKDADTPGLGLPAYRGDDSATRPQAPATPEPAKKEGGFLKRLFKK